MDFLPANTYVPTVMETVLTPAKASGAAPASKGRPREFCTEMALTAALRVFWSKGYEGASMADLTEAMGITKPSLYAAFGNKEALFQKALDRYEQEKLEYTRLALQEPTARKVAAYYLRGALEAQTSDCEPQGCMAVISGMTCGAEAESIKAEIVRRRQAPHDALVARLERAKEEGDLGPDVDIEGLTILMYTLLQGMAVQANSGATRAQLEKLVETSLSLWPSK